MFLFVFLAVFITLLFWTRWRIKNQKLLEISNQLPGPPTMPILGNAWQFMVPTEELANVIGRLIQVYGDIFRIWLGPDLNIFVSEPDDVKTLLSTPKTSFKGPQYKYIGEFCGVGILSGSGPTWRTCRKTLMPNYGKKALQSYNDVIASEVNDTVTRLRTRVGENFDIYDEIVMGTTFIVCETLLGLTKEQTRTLPDLIPLIHNTTEMYSTTFKRMTTWYLQIEPVYWTTKYNQITNKFMKQMLNLMDNIVKCRLQILDAMDPDRKIEIMNAEGDNKQNTELSIIDRLILTNKTSYAETLKQVFTVFTSSQEATAKITSYLILMMAHHPECQDKLYAEIHQVLGDSDRGITDDDMKSMPYLDMVFKEIIRLFPIGVMLQRTIGEDITLGKVTLPAGSSLVVPVYHMHRDKRYWDDPDAFDPERFTPENTRLRHPNCYLPFSLGPMDCLGRYYAYKIVKTMAVSVLREFRVTSPETYADLKLALAISVESINGYPVQLHPRK